MKTMSNALKNNNEILLELLSHRDEYFKSIETEEVLKLDDEQLKKYNDFKNKYNKLPQLEKDLWYLDTQIKRIEIAKLYDVSRSYITMLLQNIYAQLELK